jgi:hypothetical protein
MCRLPGCPCLTRGHLDARGSPLSQLFGHVTPYGTFRLVDPGFTAPSEVLTFCVYNPDTQMKDAMRVTRMQEEIKRTNPCRGVCVSF